LGPRAWKNGATVEKPRCGLSLAYYLPDCKSRATELSSPAIMMAICVWMHLTEHHEHEHVHEALSHSYPHFHDEYHRHSHEPEDLLGGPHTHIHAHAPLRHSHPHVPDITRTVTEGGACDRGDTSALCHTAGIEP
jgi:ABC-type nickel/cobalt efflux system permease component RcnA